ncbi:transposase [Pararhodobacter oceanensis]|uniref:transposase n=1 Tax=Pararhodobacter oceanensis TaxID=2172121 RepID=UPI003A8D8087
MPPLNCGLDVVILDILSSHKPPAAAHALQAIGAWFLFLPPYSPDLNPIEMAFAKVKTLTHRRQRGPMSNSGPPSDRTATSSQTKIATTSSKPHTMRAIECGTL